MVAVYTSDRWVISFKKNKGERKEKHGEPVLNRGPTLQTILC